MLNLHHIIMDLFLKHGKIQQYNYMNHLKVMMIH